MARFLCTGDTHIGHGRDLVPDRLDEQEDLWRTILELARAEKVDAVLHAGDMWERRKPTPDEYLAAERPLVEHRDAAGCPVVVCAGNHDRSGVDDNLALRVLEQAGLIRLSTEPEVMHGVTRNDVMICTLPWTPVSRLVAAEDGGDRDRIFEDAADLLLQTARELRAQVDGPAILMLHWSVSGASLPSGIPIELAREVILPVSELETLGFNAVVCGHIHRSQGISREAAPMFYVGSPMPLNFGEGNQEHGDWMLQSHTGTLSGMEDGLLDATFRPLDSRRFVTLEVDELDALPGQPTAGWFDALDVAEAFVKVRGSSAGVDVPAIRQQLAGAARVWFDLTTERSVRDRNTEITPELTELEALSRYLTAQGINGTVGIDLVDRASHYLGEVLS